MSRRVAIDCPDEPVVGQTYPARDLETGETLEYVFGTGDWVIESRNPCVLVKQTPAEQAIGALEALARGETLKRRFAVPRGRLLGSGTIFDDARPLRQRKP